MDNLSNDILKYKNGELSPEQMHALEKKALADPFLAEALEGVENISVEELATDISSIRIKIFDKRKTILFTPFRVAAGIIFLAASTFIIYQLIPKTETLALKTEKPKLSKKNEPGEKAAVGSGEEINKVDGEKLKAESENRKVRKVAPLVSADQTPIASPNKPQNVEQETDKKNEPADITQTPVQGLTKVEEQPVKIESVDDQLSKEVVTIAPSGAGAKAISHDKKKDSFAASEAQRSAAPLAKYSIAARSISGHVVSAEDGLPLPGVSVLIKATTIGTVTDLNGDYSISTELENKSLIFSFIGLQQEEINASGKNKIDVQMKDDASQLSEVVVTGVSLTKDENREPSVRLAEPVGGKKAYNNYLESNSRYPEEALKNKIKGKAGIEFKVGTDGSLTDFRVIKKLGYGCEEELIRLVKQGPGWTPSTEDNKPIPSTVRIRLRFDPAKASR